MTRNEQRLVRVLQDAIEMLRWQAAHPITAASWSTWVANAVEAIDDTVNYVPNRESLHDEYLALVAQYPETNGREMIEGDL